MKYIEIYTKDYCPYCHSTKALLRKLGLDYIEYDVGKHADKLEEMLERSRRRTVPQVFIDGAHIGGNDDLHRFMASAA